MIDEANVNECWILFFCVLTFYSQIALKFTLGTYDHGPVEPQIYALWFE